MTQITEQVDMQATIDQFITSFSQLPVLPNVENLYDQSTDEGRLRAHNVKRYLSLMMQQRPEILLIGEAPGYQGTRRTGIPFASEYIIDGLMEHAPFFTHDRGFQRAYHDRRTYREPTSTIMWRTISTWERLPLLWAAFPHHPHLPGNTETNRAPTRAELIAAQPLLQEFLAIFPVRQIVAVGNTAHVALAALGIDAIKIRHPSHGGATEFTQQLYTIAVPHMGT
jgi:uracil-DNA glycosylase